MKTHKLACTLAIVVVSVQLVMACVSGTRYGKPCGDNVIATCNNSCTSIMCPRDISCTGPTVSYYCVDTAYFASCSTYVGVPTWWIDGYGVSRCDCGGYVPGAPVPGKFCHVVAIDIIGCR